MAKAPSLLPKHVKPRDLAEHLGVSERTIREKARNLGTCRVIGKEMIFLEEDVRDFLEGIKQCPSHCTDGAASGTTGELYPAGDFAALHKRLTSKPPKKSRHKSSTLPGSVVSMDRGRV